MATVPVEDTATIGGKITAAWGNGDIRDAINFLINPPRCSVYHSATISPATATFTLHPWDTELYDSDVMHDTASNNSRLIAKTAGTYQIIAGVMFATNTTGIRAIQIRKNAAGLAAGGTLVGTINSTLAGGGTTNSVWMAKDVVLAVNDYLEVFVYQSSGGALATTAGDGISWASMRWIAT